MCHYSPRLSTILNEFRALNAITTSGYIFLNHPPMCCCLFYGSLSPCVTVTLGTFATNEGVLPASSCAVPAEFSGGQHIHPVA